MISLAGKSVLVTGASRGIGRATALMAAEAGADVAVGYRSRVAEAEEVASAIRKMGRKAVTVGGDLSDPGAVAKVIDQCEAAFGQLDHCVANAGIWPEEDTAISAMAESRWREIMAQNLDSVFLTVRGALGILRPGGSIVIVSSTAGQRGEAYHSDYAATKGGLIALTKSMCIECAPAIRVNCVAPGWVDTELSAAPYSDGGKERIAQTIPLKRVPPSEDIAGPILFLMSDWARHITGEILNVNGGSVLCG
jgi:3-oxoacyl-[acyl-carrier protein] reductase